MNHSEHARRRITEHWTTKDGERIAWADVETRHLWNIVRLLVRACRGHMRRSEQSEAEINEAHVRQLEQMNTDWTTRQAQRWRNRSLQRQQDYARVYRTVSRREAQNRRRSLSMAIDELDYRGVLPTWDDLRVAWDRACGGDGGPNVIDDVGPDGYPAVTWQPSDFVQRPWCLIELWVGFRGEPTTSAEREAQQDHAPGTLA